MTSKPTTVGLLIGPILSALSSCISFKVVIWVWILLAGVSANNITIQHWTMGFTELKPSTGHLDFLTEKSLIQCANHCGLNSMCRSLVFVKDDKLCQIHAKTFLVTSPGLSAESSAVYYERDDPDSLTTTTTPSTTTTPTTPSTTTTSTTTITASVCPADDSDFTTFILPGGGVVEYRFFMDMKRNYNDATSLCSGMGAKLYKVLDTEKLNFTQALMECQAYSADNFMVDGVYNTNTMQWVTSDGYQLPMTSEFWFPGKPNYAGVTNCVWLTPGWNRYFDDYHCTHASAYAICEK